MALSIHRIVRKRFFAAPLFLFTAHLIGCQDTTSGIDNEGQRDYVAVSATTNEYGNRLSARVYGDHQPPSGFQPGRIKRNALPDFARPSNESFARRELEMEDSTEQVLSRAESMPPAQHIHISIQLSKSYKHNLSGLARLDKQKRLGVIESIQEQLSPAQDELISRVIEMGGHLVARHWLTNSVIVGIPAGHVADILAIEGVQALHRETKIYPGISFERPPEIMPFPLPYTGKDIREAVLADELISLGYKGESGGRTKSPSNNIKVGVIEPGPLNTEHVGWLDWRGGPSRVKAAYHCDDTSCDITDMSTVVEDKSHGTAVTWAIAGSIEQGQDPAYSSSTSRQNRSGMLSEAEIYFYWANTFYGHNIITAFEQAIIDGVDIINMSFNTKGGQCSMTADSSSMNAAIADILDTGILPIGCAGNTESIHGECTLWYPALRSEIVAVSPLESFTGTPYENIEWSPWASVGGMPTQTLAGWTATTAGIDIAAPGHYRLHFTDGTDTYSFTEIWGCSMATPIVSGAAGMLREVMNDLGWDGNDAKALMVNLMLLGDASDGTAGGHSYTRVSTKTGYGRLHMHYPSDDNLESPWDWSWRSFVMNEGDRISWPVGDGTPLSHEITDWKWAFLWFESALDSTSDIVIAVWDTCPPGGGEEIVAIDPSFSLRKRIRLDDSDTEGRCLEMRAYAYLAPPEGTRVWSADYFHSGDPQLH